MDGGSEARRITLHSPADFIPMRAAGRLAAAALDMIGPHVRPGVTTGELDRICHDYILAHGATPAPLNYRGYPKSVCISINHVVCHGIPGERRLEMGDVLNIDVTVILDGWFGDSSRMYCAGPPSTKARNLIEVTYEALMRGVNVVRPGATFGDIGHAIQVYVEANRFSVVRDFCGHGLGRVFHAAPNVLQRVVDEAMQIHGGAGVSDDLPLTALFAQARVLRIADGPDEVHRGVIARIELAKYRDAPR